MRKLADFDYSSFQLENTPDFQLRIGIQAGPVIAGVVGAQKPLYDIWGDTVNVASRMDKFGVRGCIQVPERTARTLGAERISSSPRGVIDVKGKGFMSTYFIDLDDDLYVVETTISEEETEKFREPTQSQTLAKLHESVEPIDETTDDHTSDYV